MIRNNIIGKHYSVKRRILQGMPGWVSAAAQIAYIFLRNLFGFLGFFCLKKKIKKKTNRGSSRVSGVREQCKKLKKFSS